MSTSMTTFKSLFGDLEYSSFRIYNVDGDKVIDRITFFLFFESTNLLHAYFKGGLIVFYPM